MKFWRVTDLAIAGVSLAIGVAIIVWGYDPPTTWSTYLLLSIVLFDRARDESNYQTENQP